MDVNAQTTCVHRYLGAEGCREIFERGPMETLVAARVPSLVMGLSGLGLTPSE